jgi:hypothetical protein
MSFLAAALSTGIWKRPEALARLEEMTAKGGNGTKALKIADPFHRFAETHNPGSRIKKNEKPRCP